MTQIYHYNWVKDYYLKGALSFPKILGCFKSFEITGIGSSLILNFFSKNQNRRFSKTSQPWWEPSAALEVLQNYKTIFRTAQKRNKKKKNEGNQMFLSKLRTGQHCFELAVKVQGLGYPMRSLLWMMQFREASNKISWTTRLINLVSNFNLFSLKEFSTACRENQSLDKYFLRHRQLDPFFKGFFMDSSFHSGQHKLLQSFFPKLLEIWLPQQRVWGG